METSPKEIPAQSTNSNPNEPGLSLKQQRQKKQRKQFTIFLGLLGAVLLLIAAVVGFQRWYDTSHHVSAQDLPLTVTVNGKEYTVAPYAACPVDTQECAESEPTVIPTHDSDELTVRIPQNLQGTGLGVLKIYNDPALNDSQFYSSTAQNADGEPITQFTVNLTEDSANGDPSDLVVLEIQTFTVEKNSEGQEDLWSIVWSISPDPSHT